MGDTLVFRISVWLLQGFLVSGIFVSEEDTNKTMSFNFFDLMPCTKSLQSKRKKKGMERIERNIDVVKFVRHQILTAQLLKKLSDPEVYLKMHT